MSEGLSLENDALRKRVAELEDANEQLRDEIDRYFKSADYWKDAAKRAEMWNESVSVCFDHKEDIVGGECLVCMIAELEAKLATVNALRIKRAHGSISNHTFLALLGDIFRGESEVE